MRIRIKKKKEKKGEILKREKKNPFGFCCRFKLIKEQEARRKQQREEEEEKRKALEAAARETKVDKTLEETVEVENQTGGDLVVEKSRSLASDTDPSISGVVNGNPLSKDLEGNQNSTSTSETENNEGSAHFNNVEINKR